MPRSPTRTALPSRVRSGMLRTHAMDWVEGVGGGEGKEEGEEGEEEEGEP